MVACGNIPGGLRLSRGTFPPPREFVAIERLRDHDFHDRAVETLEGLPRSWSLCRSGAPHRMPGELGTSFDLRGFHDEVLGVGALPLQALEERMTRWIESQKQRAEESPRSPDL